jgi:cytochrome c peroxidase
VLVAVLGLAIVAGMRCRSEQPAPRSPAIREAFEQGLDSLGSTLDRLGVVLDRSRPESTRQAFRDARTAYKRIESLLTSLAPAAVEALNGPAPEADDDKPYLLLGRPAGFQVIEDAAFSVGGGEGPGRDSLLSTVRATRQAVTSLRAMTSRVTVSDADLLDALRLEIARIATLGIAGFDSPRSGDAIVECAVALEGARELVNAAESGGGDAHWAPVDSALARAAGYLRAHPRADSLDRLTFIVQFANPAARAVAVARRGAGPARPLRRLWRQDAPTVFESGAFDASAFTPVDAPKALPELIALGRRLFFDPTLSGPGTRSCAFCHQPGHGFTDGRALSPLLAPPTGSQRNTPTLLNSAFAPALFDDLRAQSLEMQAGVVLANRAELGGSAELAASRLRRDPSYRTAFDHAFTDEADRAVTAMAVQRALAAYVRSLDALDSRFDRAVRGDTAALSERERQGFTVFMGKGRCGTCHFLPLFNGTMPPDFARSEVEIIGVTDRAGERRARLDPDPGLAGVDAQPVHRGAFKVPTLRNIALTAPYMHNGAFETLEQVVDLYDRGGAVGSGIALPTQTLPPDSLRLTATEKAALVAFLRALTDTSRTSLATRTPPSRPTGTR